MNNAGRLQGSAAPGRRCVTSDETVGLICVDESCTVAEMCAMHCSAVFQPYKSVRRYSMTSPAV